MEGVFMQSDRNTMIISAETYDDSSALKKTARGATSKLLSEVAIAPLLSIGEILEYQHDAELHQAQLDVIRESLHNGGNLIITGHGNVGLKKVSGVHTSFVEKNVDVSWTAKEYVDFIMKSNALKRGDDVNVVLNVCYAAVRFEGKQSFAERLATEFAAAGVSANIIASINIVARADKLVSSKGDVLHPQKFKYRANPEDIRLFQVDAGLANPGIQISSPGQNFYITSDGIGFGDRLTMPAIHQSSVFVDNKGSTSQHPADNEAVIKALMNLREFCKNGKDGSLELLAMAEMIDEKSLRETISLSRKAARLQALGSKGVVIRNSHEPNYIVLTCYNNKDGSVIHLPFRYTQQDNGVVIFADKNDLLKCANNKIPQEQRPKPSGADSFGDSGSAMEEVLTSSAEVTKHLDSDLGSSRSSDRASLNNSATLFHSDTVTGKEQNTPAAKHIIVKKK